MTYFIFPIGMSVKTALAQATPHMTTENVVLVPSKFSTVLLSRLWFKRKTNREVLNGNRIACVHEDGNVRVLGKYSNEFTR
jgi:hypothetical protein